MIYFSLCKKQILIAICLLLQTSIVKGQNPEYKVYAVRFADSTYPFSVGDWADGGSKTEKVNIEFFIWLVKGNNGKNVLVDAGFLGDNEDAKEFKIGKYIRPDSALLKVGVKPEDITDIIISHPHWDHINGVTLFPNAQVWMQKEDYKYFVGEAWQKGGNYGGFAKQDVRQLVDLNLKGKVTLVDGDDKEIMPGFKVYTGSRHTFNSQYVLVDTGKNKVILASDNIWIYYNLDHLAPASVGGTLDPAGYIKAMERMKTFVTDPKFIIPGHDAAILKKFPAVSDGVIEIK